MSGDVMIFLVLLVSASTVPQVSPSYIPFATMAECEAARPAILVDATQRLIATRKLPGRNFEIETSCVKLEAIP